jgi:hypothetical protein
MGMLAFQTIELLGATHYRFVDRQEQVVRAMKAAATRSCETSSLSESWGCRATFAWTTPFNQLPTGSA